MDSKRAIFCFRRRAGSGRQHIGRRRGTMVTAAKIATWDVRRLSGSLGAEIRGIRLVEAGASDAEAIRTLLTEHLVLFFPDQHLTPDQHISFGKLFGELESHPNLSLSAERPEFFELHAYGGQGAVADEWHSD